VRSREVAAREASGAAIRIRSAGFPTRKSLEDYNFDHQPALNRDMIAHLGTGAFLAKAGNVVLLGPPGTGKTHCESCRWDSQKSSGAGSGRVGAGDRD
jgi:DNA replication protein DnaC